MRRRSEAAAARLAFPGSAPSGLRLRRWLPLALAGGMAAALAITALRVDLIRVRYGLADALRKERALLQERREALAALQAQRDPARLTRLAGKRGFERPQRILELPVGPPGSPRP